MKHREDIDAPRFDAIVDCVGEARHPRLPNAALDFGVSVGCHAESCEHLPNCQGESQTAAGPALLRNRRNAGKNIHSDNSL